MWLHLSDLKDIKGRSIIFCTYDSFNMSDEQYSNDEYRTMSRHTHSKPTAQIFEFTKPVFKHFYTTTVIT